MRALLFVTCLSALVLGVSGCAVVSEDLQVQSDPNLTFTQVKTAPERYAGEMVIWGGYIIENRAGRDKSSLVILQAPLAFNQEPKSRDASRGRFIAVADRYLDPEVYSKDRPVTVAGEVAQDTLELEGDSYGVYPVVGIREIHLWAEPLDAHPYPYGPYHFWHGPPYPHHRFYYRHYW
jgi:outer membrane lipoprotein